MRRMTYELANALAARRGRRLFDDDDWLAIARTLGLSPRELQIVQALIDDRKEATIAAALGISPHTVHSHVERIYLHLNTRSRVQLLGALVAAHLHVDELSGDGPA